MVEEFTTNRKLSDLGEKLVTKLMFELFGVLKIYKVTSHSRGDVVHEMGVSAG